MNKKILILPAIILGLGLASCSKGNANDQTIKVTASKGVTALALAGKIQDGTYTFKQNTVEATKELSNGAQEVVVTDAALGLHNLVKAENPAYTVTRVISNNSDYLIPLKGAAAPSANSVVVTYAKGSASDLALQKLCSEHWNAQVNMKYVSGALETVDVMLTGKLGELDVDFVVAPYATALVSELNLTSATSLNSAWATYTEGLTGVVKQNKIPGAVTFVSKNASKNKANGLASFYSDLDIGIKNAIENPERLQTVMNSYSQDEKQQVKFFETCATIVGEAQKENANKIELVNKDDVEDTKDYLDSFMKLVDAELTDYSNCYLGE